MMLSAPEVKASPIKFRYVCFNKHFQETELVYLTDEDLRVILAKETGISFELGKNDKHHIPSWILSDNCEIREKQLCTGELDNNKKEIYEGDRVLVETTGINYRPDKIQGTVKFIDGCFTVVFDNKVYDETLRVMRSNLYVKCFVVNHAIQVIRNNAVFQKYK